MSEPRIVVQHREELAELLSEAAEVEHDLMCCYLYAAWSLKTPADGLTPDQARRIGSWRRALVEVAIDEMTHFALVNNLLSAIGGTPHVGRPNFPIAPGYHPAGVVLELRRFERSTIAHFVHLERPEGVEEPDGEGFTAGIDYHRGLRDDVLMPTAQDFQTVGHLYRGIREGLQRLSDALGEATLFVGDPEAQLSPSMVALKGLVAVTGLASALEAVDNIVIQGEGHTEHHEDSHYARFCTVRDDLAALEREDPSFDPARAVVRNPVQRKPLVPEGRAWVSAPDASQVLDLCNAVYNHMLRLLGTAYGRLPAATRSGLVGESIALMQVLTPLNELLTRLPADLARPSAMAGMSFAMARVVRVPPPGPPVRILAERTRVLADGAARMAAIDPVIGGVVDKLSRIADRLGALEIDPIATSRPAHPRPPPRSESSADPTIPPRTLVDGVETIEGTGLTLSFDNNRCIHARFCVLGAPDVFIGNVKGPWIRPDAVEVEALVAVAHRCPSGAITYRRKDGHADEAPPMVNLATVRENGPYALHAELAIEGQSPCTRATLCRCGASKRKPFCDGSHHDVGFVASGEPATGDVTPLAIRNGPLDVRPQPDGPLMVFGNLEIVSGTGRTITKVKKAALCRCGGSSTKPFCDGTHRTNGFRS